MTTTTWDRAAGPAAHHRVHPVRLEIQRPTGERNRLTTAFRVILAVPHLMLVGGPMAAVGGWMWESRHASWTAGGGVLGAAAGLCALLSWFAIVFTGRHPEGLRSLAVFYLQWRARAAAYTALLTDRYPPFGEGNYPALLTIDPPRERDRLSVAFRFVLALPQIVAVCVLSLAWAFTTMIAWFAILFTGRYPAELYRFGVGVLRWNLRVEAYLLLLCDAYPPFSLD
jgi:hypothetical protein